MSTCTATPPARAVSLVVGLALLLLVLPVNQVYAQESAPMTRSAVLDDLPVAAGDHQLGASPGPEIGAESVDPVAPGTPGDPTLEMHAESDQASEQAQATVLRQTSEQFEAPIPFTGLGFSGSGVDEPDVRWRALLEDGEWTDWQQVEILDSYDGPDPGTAEARDLSATQRWVSDAIWVGPASHLQIAVEGAELDDLHIAVLDSAGLTESLPERVARTFRSLTTRPPAAEASTTQPHIVPRSGWVDTESCTSGTMSYATPRAAVLHHTATTNNYTPEQAPQQIRNMYHWHTSCHGINGNGWHDIGYNFIVDRFGTIYEGRRGGIERGVIGAHAGGWNTGTFGVGLMGNYNTATPGPEALRAIGALLGWKYALHGIDADGTASLNGQTIPTLVGHRNVRGAYVANPSTTVDCPGQNMYTRMSSIPIATTTMETDGWVPVVGDWSGSGHTTVGWFRDGEWRLRDSNSAGPAHHTFRFGQAGDLPVVGDWNGNGQTTVGVVRGSRWLLRNHLSGGTADISFHYGRGGIDHPMAGDWNRDGKDTPAIVRDGQWHLRNSLTGGPGEIVFTYGRVLLGDLPVVGDWNRDGRDTPGILRSGQWHLRNSLSGGPGEIVFTFGRLTRGDVPAVGDWNADGRTTIGVTRGTEWHLRNSLTGGPADVSFFFS